MQEIKKGLAALRRKSKLHTLDTSAAAGLKSGQSDRKRNLKKRITNDELRDSIYFIC